MQHLASVPVDRPASPALPSRIARLLATGWSRCRHKRRLKASSRMLHGLSDRTLRDIGIDRSEIDSVVATRAADRRHRYCE